MQRFGKNIEELLVSLAEAISEDEKLVNNYLKSSGNNPKEIEASGERFIQKIKGQFRYKLMKNN